MVVPRGAFSFFTFEREHMYEVVSELIERLDADVRELFEERAALVEHEGGLPREEAESYALLDVLRRHPWALTGVTVVVVEGMPRPIPLTPSTFPGPSADSPRRSRCDLSPFATKRTLASGTVVCGADDVLGGRRSS